MWFCGGDYGIGNGRNGLRITSEIKDKRELLSLSY